MRSRPIGGLARRAARKERVALAVLATILVLPAALSAAATPGIGGEGDVALDAGLQWGLERIGAREAWSRTTGEGVTIAIVDSGVASDHEDLRNKVLAGTACRDTGGSPDRCRGSADDDDGHGTHVAGIAAAATGNASGIASVAPDAAILPVKVLFRSCADCEVTGDAPDVAAAIRWASASGADIINLSLGSTTSSVFGDEFASAVRDAWRDGAIPVVAAGNDFVLTADFGDAPAVLVTATTREDTAPSYANGVGDARWAIAAPGGEKGDTAASCSQSGRPVGVLSTYWADGDDAAYACLSGTSMAAPHVSGALALLLAAGLDRETAIERVLATAEDLGAPGRDATFGAGLLDVSAATAGLGQTNGSPGTSAPAVTNAPTVTGAVAPVTPPGADPDPDVEGSGGQPGTTDAPPAVGTHNGTDDAPTSSDLPPVTLDLGAGPVSSTTDVSGPAAVAGVLLVVVATGLVVGLRRGALRIRVPGGAPV